MVEHTLVVLGSVLCKKQNKEAFLLCGWGGGQTQMVIWMRGPHLVLKWKVVGSLWHFGTLVFLYHIGESYFGDCAPVLYKW